MAVVRSSWLRILLAYLAAVGACAAFGAVAQTQLNLAALSALGAEIPFGLRLSTTLADLRGFAPTWAAIVGVGLLVAFPVAAWLSRRRPRWRKAVFALAGAVAVLTALWTMKLAFGLTAIAAARSALGIALLAGGGALGGWLFGRFGKVDGT